MLKNDGMFKFNNMTLGQSMVYMDTNSQLQLLTPGYSRRVYDRARLGAAHDHHARVQRDRVREGNQGEGYWEGPIVLVQCWAMLGVGRPHFISLVNRG